MADSTLESCSVLIVGLGGLGCPAAIALARAGVGELVLCDDDVVDESNLHRQILYQAADVGRDKLDAGEEALRRGGARSVRLVRSRLLPEVAREIVRSVDLVIEGADNFATKFLCADACFLENRPVVHGAAVRFAGTALSVSAGGGPCYRCLFEDLLPSAAAPSCSEAGVLGPVVGVVGALMADLALDVLEGDTSRQGQIFSFDGKRELLRSVAIHSRQSCPLCGTESPRDESDEASAFGDQFPRLTSQTSLSHLISDTRRERYLARPAPCSSQ